MTPAVIDYQAILTSAPDLYLILSPDLEIVGVSNIYAQTTMTKPAEIIGRKLFEVFPDNPADITANGVSNLRNSLDTVLETKKGHQMAIQKYDIRRPDGSFEARYWSPYNSPVLNQTGDVQYIIHRVEDITEYVRMEEERAVKEKMSEDLRTRVTVMQNNLVKQAQEIQKLNFELEKKIAERSDQLLKKEDQFKLTLDNMMEGAQIIGFDWKYIYVNNALEVHGKYPREELIGFTMMEKYPGFENTEVYRVIKDCLENRNHHHFETHFFFPDGSDGWFELSIQPVEQGVFILSLDITERKKAEGRMQKLNEELEEKVALRTQQLVVANKELETFSYSVSHDLKAPLRALQGFSKNLEQKYANQLDETAVRWLNFIKDNAERMDSLIDDILSFSRVSRAEIKKHTIDMSALVRYVFEREKQLYKQPVKFHMEDLPSAVGDRGMFEVVWQNLVGNALKYSAKNEIIEIYVTGRSNEKYNVYHIRDNGAGFDMKYVDKLFNIFQRLHHTTDFEGTGIGLATVKRIVEKHGGTIKAHAEPDQGAAFEITLPKN